MRRVSVLTMFIIITGLHGWDVNSAPYETSASQDMHSLQGVWIVDLYEREGQRVPTYEGRKMIVTDDRITVEKDTDFIYKLDTSTNPRAIDRIIERWWLGLIGVRETSEGIYSLDGDIVRFCFGSAKSGRPDSFSTKPNSQRVLMILRREKAR